MSSSRPTAARLHHAWALPLGAVVVLALAACGGGAGTTKAQAAAPAASASAGTRPGSGTAQQDRGGVRGTIAAVTGQLMQLQDTSSQTAVAWTASTTITAQVAGTLADVKPGVCVLAVTAPTGTSSTASASGAATSVAISQPVNGACTAGFGAGTPGTRGAPGGGMPSGAPAGGQRYGTRPSGAPTAGAGGFVRPVDGLVTAVSGDTITVQTTTGTGGTATSGTATTGTATVTVDSATTFRTTKAADASAIVVGQCATARGQADSSGKVTATSIVVSPPTNGTCVTANRGFGGNRSGQGQTGQQGAPAAGTNA